MYEERPSDSDSAVWKQIEHHEAVRAFDSLVAAGAQRETLLGLLVNLHSYPRLLPLECFEAITEKGLSRREVNAQIQKVWKLIGPISQMVPLACFGPGNPRQFERFEELPATLNLFVLRVRLLLKRQKFKEPLHWNHMLAMLVSYVRGATRGYRDEALSSLISSVTGQTYDATALKQWRHRNKVRLRRAVLARR